MSTDLKPCPHCGKPSSMQEGESFCIAWVTCSVCSAQGPVHDDVEAARQKWNQRPVEARQAERIQALEKIVVAWKRWHGVHTTFEPGIIAVERELWDDLVRLTDAHESTKGGGDDD